jgi:hypothetical protein
MTTSSSNQAVSEVVGGYHTKARNILPQPRVPSSATRYQPCSTGAQLLQHGQRQQQSNPRTSGDNIQEMLPQPPLLAQIVLWPLENQQNQRLPPPMSAQIAPKPSQHLQDRIRAPQLLHADVLEHHHQLQASTKMEARMINKLL